MLLLVDSFSKGNRSCFYSWTLGLGCTAFGNSIRSPLGCGWLLWACLNWSAGQPTGRFPMGSPTVAVLKDRVARPFLINLVILAVSLTGLVHWGARVRGRCSVWEHFQIPLKHGPHWTGPSVYRTASSGTKCTGDAYPSLQGNCSPEHWWFSWEKEEAWLVFTVCW